MLMYQIRFMWTNFVTLTLTLALLLLTVTALCAVHAHIWYQYFLDQTEQFFNSLSVLHHTDLMHMLMYQIKFCSLL